MPATKGSDQNPIRLKPGIVIVSLQWLVWIVIPFIFPGSITDAMGVLGGILGGILILVWWVFFSRAPLIERLGALVMWIVALLLVFRFTHESITSGMQGMMFFAFSLPVLSLAFVLWAVASRKLSKVPRRVTMILTILMASGIWIFLRSDGMTGDAGIVVRWRWSDTHEEKLLSQSGNDQNVPESQATSLETTASWPGFRGSQRNGVVEGVQIKADWSVSPPVEVWRKPVGPGCSSFAVQGNVFFTQEQRGSEEVVACYKLNSGEPVWKHHDKARFWDSHAGAGPRSTPTLSNGQLYTLGATGILNALNAADGTVLWSRNAASDAGIEAFEWGFTSSPLVVDEIVIVALAGKLAAYDKTTGKSLWFGPDGGESYSSPHLFSIDGIQQVIMMSNKGATSFLPENGSVLWEHKLTGARVVQPARCENGDLLISTGGAKGVCRLTIRKDLENWTVTEQWTSNRLRPNFNDFVIHKGYAYGYEGLSLTCVELEEGKRKWKGGRYGGQVLLLADQDLLLVLSEKGEVALLEARSKRLIEKGRFQAIEGKTWNHPALAGDLLLVRNSQEMAAYRLSTTGD